ncbi:MAG: hypothetical protein WCC70_03485 [Candidatus Aquilonibacter sp.]
MRFLAAIFVAAALANYHLAATHVLGGDGGWDYLSIDPSTKHLFISRSTHVMVVDSRAAASSAIFRTPRACTASRSPQISGEALPPTAATAR